MRAAGRKSTLWLALQVALGAAHAAFDGTLAAHEQSDDPADDRDQADDRQHENDDERPCCHVQQVDDERLHGCTSRTASFLNAWLLTMPSLASPPRAPARGRSPRPFLFLACDDSSYMTGQVLHPNGGTPIAS